MNIAGSKSLQIEPMHGIIVLAAGASNRLGRPKQLEKSAGEPLLSRVLRTAIATGHKPIATVLGAYSQEILPTIAHFPVTVLQNADWEAGMGSSLSLAVRYFMEKFPGLSSVIVLVCDQYLLTSDHINLLISVFERTGKDIVASEYGGTVGVPALFAKNKFPVLACLPGNEGAKLLIQRYPENLAVVPFPEGIHDLDTETDTVEYHQAFQANQSLV